VLETVEAGIELKGPEVKSIRAGHVSFQDAHARVERGQIWLHSLHVSPYEQANRFNVDPVRPRRLLLNKHEIHRLSVKVEEKGLTLVPLQMYFKSGRVKVALALVKGKQAHDKRETIRRREVDRETRAAVKAHSR